MRPVWWELQFAGVGALCIGGPLVLSQLFWFSEFSFALAVTHPQARALHEQYPDAAGLRWWSSYEALWANVRRTIEDFLLNEWQSGALLGEKPEKAYFVRCDRSTMTQNDLDNGRLICLIGVAPSRPAEFVIFRIGQWTADAQQ